MSILLKHMLKIQIKKHRGCFDVKFRNMYLDEFRFVFKKCIYSVSHCNFLMFKSMLIGKS